MITASITKRSIEEHGRKLRRKKNKINYNLNEENANEQVSPFDHFDLTKGENKKYWKQDICHCILIVEI
jgi:hypothetical protein